MKALILLITFFLTFTSAYAQWSNRFLQTSSDKHFLFASGDVIAGNYNGGDVGINYIYKNKYSVKLGFFLSEKLVTSIPNNFLKSGETLSSVGLTAPTENLENFHFLVGRVFSFGAKDRLRLTIQGGPGISTVREPVFQENGNKSNLSSAEYAIDYQKVSHASFTINPKVEFPLACVFGISVGPMLILNQERTFLGASIGFMYGITGCNTM
jgi:hypothetical protein